MLLRRKVLRQRVNRLVLEWIPWLQIDTVVRPHAASVFAAGSEQQNDVPPGDDRPIPVATQILIRRTCGAERDTRVLIRVFIEFFFCERWACSSFCFAWKPQNFERSDSHVQIPYPQA